MKSQIPELNEKFKNKTALEILDYVLTEFKDRAAFSTSLGAEDQILTHLIVQTGKAHHVKIFTLDTGRLFYETYETLDKTIKKYNIQIQVYFPHFREVEDMVNEHGINLFYESIEKRKLCCKVRKVEPLYRALDGYDIWITGIRREQNITRKAMELFEWDEDHQIIKVNPLIDWKENEVWKYLHKERIPYNILHDKGYPSIGCAPCTRAVEKGEDPRNGRWWWENPETRECGLHLKVKTS